jgi:adenylate cyclase
MAKEIEHKFIAAFASDHVFSAPFKYYEQAYIVTGDPEVRIRRTMSSDFTAISIAGTYYMAVKSGAGLIREEIEFSIPDADGLALFAMAKHKIKKRRHHAGNWEIDVFSGELDGLLIAEIEVDDPSAPVPPPPAGIHLLKDVTHDPAFKNKALFLMDRETVDAHIGRDLGV